MTIHLTNNESKTFFNIINGELRCVINEYDDDTGRCPGKQRINDSKHAKSIIQKWIATQPKIQNTAFINLDVITECDIDLSKPEITYTTKLLNKVIKKLEKELAVYNKPYTGYIQNLDNIVTTSKAIIQKLHP